MKRMLEFPLDAGSSVLVEIDDASSGMEQAANVVERSHRTFSQAFDRLGPIAEAVVGRLLELDRPAEEVKVTFGLKMSAETGVFIASATAEANYQVTILWRRQTSNSTDE